MGVSHLLLKTFPLHPGEAGMISEYHRPKTLEEALSLLARPGQKTAPLAGGSILNQPSAETLAVVDLQALGLDGLQTRGNVLDLGATLTLQRLLESPQAADLPPALLAAMKHEAAFNLRQVATVAGTLVAADGRSPFTTALLALDAQLTLRSAGGPPAGETISLGDLLPLRGERLSARLITQVSLPLNARLAYEYVARTPADLPLVCAAAAAWRSGRTRLALGGFGQAPVLAFDGTEPEGVEIAAESAYSQAGDAWATAGYRSQAAAALAKRCMEGLKG
jgi:CO/xanthine dehydrogenase FAD-binding subunit